MIKPLLIISSIFLTLSAFSDGLYSIEISSTDLPNATPFTQDYDNIDALIKATEQKNIALTGYTQNSQATIDIMLGNTPASISYAQGSTALVFLVEGCDVNKTFSGFSRTANETSFRDYINNNEEGVLGKISDCLLEDNPHDPVAIQIREMAEFGPEFIRKNNLDNKQENFGVGLVAGHFSTGEQSHSILTLPLSYTHYYKEKGRNLKLTAPISFIDVNGSKAYKISLGAAYTRSMNERWTIIPAARLGITASNDMGTGATILSATVTNVYNFPYGDKHITLANMVGVIKSLDLDIGKFKSYYDVNNQVIKNGIAVELPQTYRMFGGKTSLQVSLANTQFFGDKINIDNYTDVAISFGTRRKVSNKDNSQDSIQLGLTYTVGNHGYKGGKLNFGYEF